MARGQQRQQTQKQQTPELPEGFQTVVQIGQDYIGVGVGLDFQTGGYEVVNIRRMFIPRGEDRFQPTKAGISIPVKQWASLREALDKLEA